MLLKGSRSKIVDLGFNTTIPIKIEVQIDGRHIYDTSIFGVNSNDKLEDDRYMVFFNQPSSPNGEIKKIDENTYEVLLDKMPQTVNKLVLTASIDGDGVMGEINNIKLKLSQNNIVEEMILTGNMFKEQKALILIEIYLKDTWRLNVTASGFDGGLSALLKHFGGEEAEEEEAIQQQPEQPQQAVKISLEKKVQEKTPELISLVKPIKVSLEKHKLEDEKSQVVLLMDISGSMSRNYSSGIVKEFINRVVPLALHFDDNGSFDFLLFGSKHKYMPDVTPDNYKTCLDNWREIMNEIGSGTDLSKPMKDVYDKFGKNSNIPVYVICVTDGSTSNAGKVEKMIKEGAKYPVFWQFIGIGRESFGLLEKLDDLRGRVVDNADFTPIKDLSKISDSELYNNLLKEFPNWLKEARAKGIL